MFYSFPIIKHINDILPHIDDNFKVYEKEDYIVINYMLVGNDTFPPVQDLKSFPHPENEAAAFRRECRGIIFEKNGKVIRRAYHKFFNHGEREETLTQNVDWASPHVFLEKLDGSMVTPLLLGPYMRWATKAGITDISMQAEVFVATRNNYQIFAKEWLECGYTPIFEWCSRQNRIIIDYPKENLILTGVRDRERGEYIPFTKMAEIANYYNIPIVEKINPPEYLELIDEIDNKEGVVIRFDNGHMLKVKTSTYLQIHRAKENLIHEKRLLEIFLQDKMDDILPHLPDSDRQLIFDYLSKFWEGFTKVSKEITTIRNNWTQTRKEFAINSDIPALYKSIIFSCWDNPENVQDEILNRIEKNLGSQSMVDKVRLLWDNKAVWNYHTINE